MDVNSYRKLSPGVLEYLVNYMFLPPNIPQEDGFWFDHKKILLKVVAYALAQFKGCARANWFSVTDEVIDMVQNLENMLDLDGIINEERPGHALCQSPGTTSSGGRITINLKVRREEEEVGSCYSHCRPYTAQHTDHVVLCLRRAAIWPLFSNLNYLLLFTYSPWSQSRLSHFEGFVHAR
jgi:hypothetical protein